MTIQHVIPSTIYKDLQKQLASIYKIEEQPIVWADVDLLSFAERREVFEYFIGLYINVLNNGVKGHKVSLSYDISDIEAIAFSFAPNSPLYSIETDEGVSL